MNSTTYKMIETRLPKPPEDAISDHVDQIKRQIRRTRESALVSLSRAIRKSGTQINAEFTAHCSEVAANLASDQCESFRTRTQIMYTDGMPLARIRRALCGSRGIIASELKSADHAGAGIQEQIDSLSAQAKAAEAAIAQKEQIGFLRWVFITTSHILLIGLILRLYRRLFGRTRSHRLAVQTIDYLAKVENCRLKLVIVTTTTSVLRAVSSAIEAELAAARECDHAACDIEQASGRTFQRAATLMKIDFLHSSEDAESLATAIIPVQLQPTIADIHRRRLANEGDIRTLIADSARQLVQNSAFFPRDIEQFVNWLSSDKKRAKFRTMSEQSLPTAISKFHEAAISTRHRYRVVQCPRGSSASYFPAIQAENLDRTPTVAVDASTDSNELRITVYEMGLAASQLPFLVAVKRDVPDDIIRRATMWPGADSLDLNEIAFERVNERLDSEDEAFRRLCMALVLGLIKREGNWYATTADPTLNGTSQTRLGQGINAAVDELRSGPTATAIDAAIATRKTTDGIEAVIKAIDNAAIELPEPYAMMAQKILHTEVTRLRRQLLA